MGLKLYWDWFETTKMISALGGLFAGGTICGIYLIKMFPEKWWAGAMIAVASLGLVFICGRSADIIASDNIKRNR